MTAYYRNFLIVLVLTIVAVIIYNIVSIERKPPMIDYTSFLSSIEKKEIKSVLIKGGEITGQDIFDRSFYTFAPDITPVINRLKEQGVTITTAPGKSSSSGGLLSFLPWIVIMGVWMFFMFSQKKRG